MAPYDQLDCPTPFHVHCKYGTPVEFDLSPASDVNLIPLICAGTMKRNWQVLVRPVEAVAVVVRRQSPKERLVKFSATTTTHTAELNVVWKLWHEV